MSFLASLIEWANVPFTVALGITVTFALLQVSGLLGVLAGGEEHDAHGDAHGDSLHADGHEGGHGAGRVILDALGVGRVPVSILWQTYAVAFALLGLGMNAVYLGRHDALPPHTLAWTLPVALLGGFVTTRTLAGFLGRLLADPEQEATSRRQLVGQTGVVISSKVDGEFGEVRIRDKTGHVVRVICTTRERRPIAEGHEVVVVEYDPDRDRLLVAPMEADEPPPARRVS